MACVVLAGLSEELFWHADFSMLRGVYQSKLAYDAYINAERAKAMGERR